jgi:hypothetical protein
MSVRSFHSVFMATAVAGAALGCYLVSLRVASERAALEEVESRIVATQADIRLLQTEIGTRGRLAQLERWNVRALALSAPSAGQILSDKFQLAKLVQPQRKLEVDAPVVLAAAPAPPPPQPLSEDPDADAPQAPAAQLLHEASVKLAERDVVEKPIVAAPANAAEAKPVATKAAPAKSAAADKKAGDKSKAAAAGAVTKPVRTAKADPLAPLPAGHSTSKVSRSER